MQPTTLLLLVQIANVVLIAAIVLLIVLAFRRMRSYQFTKTHSFLWSILILLVPFIGAIVFLYAHPKKVERDNACQV